MCQIEFFRFRCVCPQRDERACPHHNYVETNSDSDASSTPNSHGFYFRKAFQPQRHRDWENLRNCRRWKLCETYITASEIGTILQAATIDKLEFSPLDCPRRHNSPNDCPDIIYRMASLCDHCRLGHLGYKAGDKAAVIHKWAAVAPQDAWAWADEMKAKQVKRDQPKSADLNEEGYITISKEFSSIPHSDPGHKRHLPYTNIKGTKKAKGLVRGATYVATTFLQIATRRYKPQSSTEEGHTTGEDPEDYVDELFGSDVETVNTDSDLEEADW